MHIQIKKKLCTRFTAMLLLISVLSACGTDDQELHPGLTKEQGEKIMEELLALRSLVEEIHAQQKTQNRAQPKRPDRATISASEQEHSLGLESAPVTVVEFTDYECPFCKRFSQNTFPLIQRDFIKTGKVRWIVRDLPLGFHPNAKSAATAAYCAGEQGNFWKMRDSLFRNNSALGTDSLASYAGELGLDVASFDRCMTSGKYIKRIEKNAAEAQKQGLTGTPSFVIANTPKGSDGKLTGSVVIGAQSIAVFSAQIDRLLEPGR